MLHVGVNRDTALVRYGGVMGENSGVTEIPWSLVVYSVATGGIFTQLCMIIMQR